MNREEEDRKGVKKEDGEEEEEGKSIDYTVISGSPGNKQQFLEDQVTTSESLLPSVHRLIGPQGGKYVSDDTNSDI